MLRTKKQKIRIYLSETKGQWTPFDFLLCAYLSGSLVAWLNEKNLTKTEVCIDWMPAYKCIDIQGKLRSYYVNIQIEPKSFSVAYSIDEPDEAIEHTLKSAEQFYEIVEHTLYSLNSEKE